MHVLNSRTKEILWCFLFYFHTIFRILNIFNLLTRNKQKKYNRPLKFIYVQPKNVGYKK